MAHGHTKKHEHCDHCLHDCGPCDAAYCCNCSKEWRNCHAFHGWYNPWPYRPYNPLIGTWGSVSGSTTISSGAAPNTNTANHVHAHA